MTTITIVNPFSGAVVERDISEITAAELDAYAQVIDDETLEALHGMHDSPAEWLEAYVARVGAVEAGRVILGS